MTDADVKAAGPQPEPEGGAGVDAAGEVREGGAGGSTGPRTAEGKAAASRNALKHGLTAEKVENAVDPAVHELYEAMRKRYLEEFRPEGAIENTLMDMVVLAAWQLYKIRQIETFSAVDLGVLEEVGKSERLVRYRAANERLLFRSLNQLRAIQQERAQLVVERMAALPERLAPGVKVRPLAARVEKLRRQPKVMRAGVGAEEKAGGLKPLKRALALRRERREGGVGMGRSVERKG